MVGIGEGATSAEHDIRQGNIVVSRPEGSHGSVIQHDLGKIGKDEEILISTPIGTSCLLENLRQARNKANKSRAHWLEESLPEVFPVYLALQ